MPPILVPGVAQVAAQGIWGSQPWAVIFHFKYDNDTSPWSPTNIQALADHVHTAWVARLSSHQASNLALTSVSAVDLGTSTPSLGTNTTNAPGLGTGGGPSSSAICTVISKHIAARYRGGHPRSYMPIGLAGNVANEYEWNPAYVTTVGQDFTNFIGDIRSGMPAVGGNQVSEVCVKYTYTYTDDPVHHKYHKTRTGLQGTYIVQSYQAQLTFGTQRRRLTTG